MRLMSGGIPLKQVPSEHFAKCMCVIVGVGACCMLRYQESMYCNQMSWIHIFLYCHLRWTRVSIFVQVQQLRTRRTSWKKWHWVQMGISLMVWMQVGESWSVCHHKTQRTVTCNMKLGCERDRTGMWGPWRNGFLDILAGLSVWHLAKGRSEQRRCDLGCDCFQLRARRCPFFWKPNSMSLVVSSVRKPIWSARSVLI